MAQFARPDALVTNTGGWTDEAGGSTNIHLSIDETVADDATTYIKSATPPGASEYECGLSNVTDPVSSTGHIIRWKRRKMPAGGAQINLAVRLMQSTTEIVPSTADNNIPETTFTNATAITLSGAQADAITDYTALQLEFVASQV